MAEASADPNVRALVTPEGIDLRVRIASVSERAIALIIDLCIICGVLLALTLFAVFALVQARGESTELVAVIWLLGFFLLRNFYFTLFECGARSATPGKRIMKLRVAARHGGALSADAVVARNAMRELELYLPIVFLISSADDIGALIILCGVIWCGVFVLLPLFNRDRLRAGDLIAGTWVLKAPRQALLPDLVEEAREVERFVFTEAQLDVYGVKELQVLETVLRNAKDDVMAAVADRIRTKIDWRRVPFESDAEFLNAYYAQLRRRLERRLLFGVRKRDKFDKA